MTKYTTPEYYNYASRYGSSAPHIADALVFDNQRVAPEKALVIDTSKVLRNKIMTNFYKYLQLTMFLITLLIILACIIWMVILSLNDGLWLKPIIVIILVSGLFITLLPNRQLIDGKIIEIKKTNDIYTSDFLIFKEIMHNVDKKHHHLFWKDFFNTYGEIDNNLIYKLFNLVNIYAMDSFLEAARQKDSDAILRLIEPFMEKIVEDIVKDFEKHNTIEHEFRNLEKSKLKSQIDLDIAVFNKNK